MSYLRFQLKIFSLDNLLLNLITFLFCQIILLILLETCICLIFNTYCKSFVRRSFCSHQISHFFLQFRNSSHSDVSQIPKPRIWSLNLSTTAPAIYRPTRCPSRQGLYWDNNIALSFTSEASFFDSIIAYHRNRFICNQLHHQHRIDCFSSFWLIQGQALQTCSWSHR